MIRYYERIGLIAPANRTSGNYRVYDDSAIETLRFIGRARAMGFSLEEVGRLLALWSDKSKSSGELHALVNAHVRDLRERIATLERMCGALEQLAGSFADGDRSRFPLFEDVDGDPRH